MNKMKVALERLGSGETENLTLEEAVRSAKSGDTIVLGVGVYKLKGTLLIDHASLTLKGQDVNKSIITSSSGGSVVRFMGAFNWTVHNIGFQYTGRRWANVVEVDGDINAKVRIHHCSFSGAKQKKTTKDGGAGLLVWGSTGGEVKSCEAFDNDAAGIRIDNCAHPTLFENICRDNGIAGILYNDLAGGIARGNICRSNQCGIVILDQARPQLVANKFGRSGKKTIDWRNGDLDDDGD